MRTSRARAVIVGAGLAGLRAAQALRRAGLDGELTIVGSETEPPYSRPPLSKQVLLGSADPDSCLFDCGGLEARWLLGHSATGLDIRRKVVVVEGHDEIRYDKLVIATGCRPRPWPRPVSLAGVRLLRTLAEAIALRDAVAECGHVTVLGGGFLGCEVAATLRQRSILVSMIDVAAYPMSRLGPEIGGRVARLHSAHGVDLHFGTSVTAFEGHRQVEGVRLSDGRSIETDLVLLALGARPNIEWLDGSGLVFQAGGVLCDEHCLAVGAEDVAVAGDVAAWPHRAAGGVARVEHWTNAAEMGLRAATNLLAAPSERRRHTPVLTFWSDQYDVKIRAAGLIDRADSRYVVSDDPHSGRVVVEGRSNRRLVGAVTFNDSSYHLRHRSELATVAE